MILLSLVPSHIFRAFALDLIWLPNANVKCQNWICFDRHMWQTGDLAKSLKSSVMTNTMLSEFGTEESCMGASLANLKVDYMERP